jgi:rhamnogalacturonyl hydrolase YesR
MPFTNSSSLVDKVKLAMLSMQRDAWEQGVAAQALLESGDQRLVILLAREAVLRQHKDGRLAVVRPTDAVTDPAANGEAVLYAARATGEALFTEAADRMLYYLLEKAPCTQEGTLHHISSHPQLWIDSMYMAPPFLAVAGYPQVAVRQVEGYRRRLWNAENKLFSHIWDEGSQEFIRKDFWGVGNGWAAAGMTRVIRALPTGMDDQEQRLVAYVKEVVDGCLAHQREDGLFHDVVDNPQTFVETNLAQMLAYTIYRGLGAGWLDESYHATADRMREAVHSRVDDEGLVQGVCGSPNFDHSGTATEGQAFFLLMEAACQDLPK